jgi:opacity protein-like surface antigen
MKRILATIMSLVLLAGAALPAAAQGYRGRYDTRATQTRSRYYDARRAYDRRNDDRSFLDQHRDKATVAAGAGIGALIGALAGGGKGAAIGALVGGGGSALYTYKLRDRNNRYHRRY